MLEMYANPESASYPRLVLRRTELSSVINDNSMIQCVPKADDSYERVAGNLYLPEFTDHTYLRITKRFLSVFNFPNFFLARIRFNIILVFLPCITKPELQAVS